MIPYHLCWFILFLFAVTRFSEKATMALLWNLNSNKTVTCFDGTGFVSQYFLA